MQDARVFVLLGKKLSNEATDAELNELGRLLEDAAVQPYLLELLHEVWQKKTKADEALLDEKWMSLEHRLGKEDADAPFITLLPAAKKGTGIFSRWAFAAAACISGLLLFSAWFFTFRSDAAEPVSAVKAASKDSVIVALNGERKQILLPDSTRVHLNSGSRLEFKKDFGKDNREVWLTGEAFFEVKKDKAHPFLVNTNRMMVKVLGTVFNVKAYDTKEDIETTVVEGKVEVSLKEDVEKKVVLLPREKISLRNNKMYHSGKDTSTVLKLNYEVQTIKPAPKEKGMPVETVWVNEKVMFEEEPFEIVALKMERWYNVHIHFEKDKTKRILMTGDFDKVSIEEALQILQIMVRFKYDIKGDNIYIR